MTKTLPFLKKLKSNNNKEWFEKNRPDYEVAKAEMLALTERLIKKVSKHDPSIGTMEPKKAIFRINRDVRFSKNKDPYKSNMGAYMAEGGKKSPKGGYYLHIEPSNCFLAGGMWMPEPEVLKKVRQEIDYNGDDLEKILKNKKFTALFGGLSEEDKLARSPKDTDPNHKHAELLKLKSYIVVHHFPDKLISDPKFDDYCVSVFKEMTPLIRFLNAGLE